MPALHEKTARFDLYGPVHKGLRLFMSDTLTRVGRLDVDDRAECDATTTQLEQLVQTLQDHLMHEEDFIHPLLERFSPGQGMQVRQEHRAHRASLVELGGQLQAMRRCPDAAQAEALYQSLALVVAETLEHMQLEDVQVQAQLWAHCSDAELVALHERLVASIPPADFMALLKWILPAVSPQQCLGMLQGMRASAPPPVFAAVADLAQRCLDAAAWAKLARGLGLAPVPGLVEV